MKAATYQETVKGIVITLPTGRTATVSNLLQAYSICRENNYTLKEQAT